MEIMLRLLSKHYTFSATDSSVEQTDMSTEKTRFDETLYRLIYTEDHESIQNGLSFENFEYKRV